MALVATVLTRFITAVGGRPRELLLLRPLPDKMQSSGCGPARAGQPALDVTRGRKMLLSSDIISLRQSKTHRLETVFLSSDPSAKSFVDLAVTLPL